MPNEGHGQGRKYFIDVEGVEYEWDAGTISVPQLRALAGIPAGTEMLEVNLKTNEETPISEGAIVELKPGHGFGKKIKFKRG